MDRRHFMKVLGIGSAVTSDASVGAVSSRHESSCQSIDTLEFGELCQTDVVLIACGGAGIEMTKGIEKVAYGIPRIIALDTDKRALLSARHCDAFFWVRREDGREVASADEAWYASEARREEIRRLVGRPAVAIIVTGLGGAAAFGLPYMVASCARQAGALTLAFATWPLAYESPDSESLAPAAKSVLSEKVHNLLIYDHRIVDRCIPTACRKSSIYRYASFGLRQYLWNTVGCLNRYGILAIDWEDVRTVLSQTPDHPDSVGQYSCPASRLGWGSAEGVDRARQAAQKALQHPLIEIEKLSPLHGISVSIRAASRTLPLREIHTIMDHVRQFGAPSTWVVFSADSDDTLRGKLQVSVIAVPKGEAWLDETHAVTGHPKTPAVDLAGS